MSDTENKIVVPEAKTRKRVKLPKTIKKKLVIEIRRLLAFVNRDNSIMKSISIEKLQELKKMAENLME